MADNHLMGKAMSLKSLPLISSTVINRFLMENTCENENSIKEIHKLK